MNKQNIEMGKYVHETTMDTYFSIHRYRLASMYKLIIMLSMNKKKCFVECTWIQPQMLNPEQCGKYGHYINIQLDTSLNLDHD